MDQARAAWVRSPLPSLKLCVSFLFLAENLSALGSSSTPSPVGLDSEAGGHTRRLFILFYILSWPRYASRQHIYTANHDQLVAGSPPSPSLQHHHANAAAKSTFLICLSPSLSHLPFNTTPIRLMKEHLASPNFSTNPSLPAFTNCAYTHSMELLIVLFTSVPQQASSMASMTSGAALFGFHKVGTRCLLHPIDGYPFFSPSRFCVAMTYEWRAANWTRITSRVTNACEHREYLSAPSSARLC